MSWTKTEIHDLLIRQKAFFQTGKTLSIPFRMEMLRKLRQAVIAHEQELTEALEKDLGRHPAEGYFCDVGTIVLEINETGSYHISVLGHQAKGNVSFTRIPGGQE